MARRRRRRERRDASTERVPKTEKRAVRAEDRRRDAFDAQQRSLRRRRTFVGALAFIPLLFTLGCGAGLEVLCALPRDWAFAIFAALFGSYLGLTIRMFLERRRFQRGAASG